MTISLSDKFTRRRFVAPVILLFACMSHSASLAQGLDAEGTIKTIIGSEVQTVEEAVASDAGRVIAAIEKSLDNAAEVRKRFSLDNVRIVFLPDLDDDGSDEEARVKAAMEKFRGEITTLREAVQGSAIFYHAINSHSVLLNDIVAVEFGDENDVTILVAGRER